MRFCRRTLILAAGLAVGAMGLPSAVSRGQEATRPAALVSIAPLDRLLQDTSYLLRASNIPEIGGLVSIMANQYTQGLDRARPIGVSISLDGQIPSGLVFLPLKDRSQFFAALAGMGVQPDDLGDGLYEIDANRQKIFAKESGQWLFVSQSEDALVNLPADPASALGELPQQYDLAFRVNVQALPEELKQMAVQQMRVGFERSLAEQGGQSEEQRATAKRVGDAQIAQIEQLMDETDQLILGWNVEPSKQRVYLDMAAQFREGSKLALQTAAMQDLSSQYAELTIPNAAAHFRFASRIADEDKETQKQNLRSSLEQIKGQINNSGDLPDDAKSILVNLVEGLAKISEQTIEEGLFDGAGSLSVADDSLRLLIGGRLADGQALKKELQNVLGGLANQPNAPQAEFDYATYKGFALHRLVSPLDQADPTARQILGDKLVVTIGTSDKGFLVSMDPAGDATLKAGIDRLATAPTVKVSPFEAVVQVGQLLKFAQAVSPNSMVDSALQTVQQYSGKDKVEVTGRMIPRGGMYRLSIEEGVLRSIGAAAKSSSGRSGGF